MVGVEVGGGAWAGKKKPRTRGKGIKRKRVCSLCKVIASQIHYKTQVLPRIHLPSHLRPERTAGMPPDFSS